MSRQAKRALGWAIQRAGSERALADAIETTPQLVKYWATRSNKGAAAEYVLRIEATTGISRHLLRPDIYPRETAAA